MVFQKMLQDNCRFSVLYLFLFLKATAHCNNILFPNFIWALEKMVWRKPNNSVTDCYNTLIHLMFLKLILTGERKNTARFL